ncbi:unnamed protein product [Triticum turgidum subsp. durum]|uniref:Uncharacterized protein n=1 Tax=Triticum turgidum subsp. durum TaxID=4567 RepID=A0A9R1Q785_TRITD|nr:unnamed protein product [Triticum turgidum subsp. durum]
MPPLYRVPWGEPRHTLHKPSCFMFAEYIQTGIRELKSVIRLLPVWASGIVFATVYGQSTTMFVLQGNTLEASMGPHFSIPSASLTIFDTLSVIAWVPVYDRLLVPAVRSVTGHPRGFTQLQRMGIGLVVSMFSMVAAVPQYFIVGAAEVFVFVGQLEFFYDQAPDAMKSMCTALSLTTVALGNYVITLLVTVFGIEMRVEKHHDRFILVTQTWPVTKGFLTGLRC